MNIWKTDGTASGTSRVTNIGSASGPLTVFNDELYFVGFNGIDNGQGGVSGFELWKTDGTTNGTVVVADMNPDFSSNPEGLIVFNNELYFSAHGLLGRELWKTDGTANGTVQVADINSGSASSNPMGFTVVNDELFFYANAGASGLELWKTDGTDVGTVPVADANAPFALGKTFFNNEFYYPATNGTSGLELWKSDGTAGGTIRVADINPGSGSSSPSNLTVFNNELYFVADDGTTGAEVWKTDGTAGGTVRLADLNTGSGSYPGFFMPFDGELYFSANDDSSGNRRFIGDLWKTNGTTAGTVRVTAFVPSESYAELPAGVWSAGIATDEMLLFVANDGVTGLEPWVIRAVTPVVGPENLAEVIADLAAGATEVQASATPSNLNAFFTAIANLPAISGDVIDIVLNLGEGDYEGAVVEVPAGYRVIINGAAGQVVFHGASPSLTLQSGDLRVTGVTFVNNTDASSIVVNGGSLVIRDSLLRETTDGGQAAIEINGGSVDLGTLADAGGNTLEVSGSGEFMRNFTNSPVSAVGNEYELNGAALSGDILAVPEWMRLVIDESGSGVALEGGFSLTVTVNDATWEIGAPFVEFAVSYEGFVHGDAENVLAGELEFFTDANETSRVGDYAVLASGLASNKYAITYVAGTLEITPANVDVDLQPANLNVDQNGAISLVIFGASTFDVSQITLSSLTFAGVSIGVFNHSLVDADQDGVADLRIHFQSTLALKEALRQLYSDLLVQDFEADGEYAKRQETLIAIDGAFGQYDQEFQGSDATSLFLAGNSLKTLLQHLEIAI